MQKGLVPYVDFMPMPKVKKDYFYWYDPDKKINLRRDAANQIANMNRNRWGAVLRIANTLFGTPGEAIDVLLRETTIFKTRDSETFILCAMIEKDMKTSKQPLNKVIETNLEKYCPLISVDYNLVIHY